MAGDGEESRAPRWRPKNPFSGRCKERRPTGQWDSNTSMDLCMRGARTRRTFWAPASHPTPRCARPAPLRPAFPTRTHPGCPASGRWSGGAAAAACRTTAASAAARRRQTPARRAPAQRGRSHTEGGALACRRRQLPAPNRTHSARRAHPCSEPAAGPAPPNKGKKEGNGERRVLARRLLQ